MGKTRVVISFDDEILKKIDQYAELHGMTRTSFVNLACTEYLTSIEKVPSLSAALVQFAQIMDDSANGKISYSDTIDRLNDVSKSLEKV